MLLKEFILYQLNDTYPKKVGDKQVVICCPFHHETKPSLYISLVHDKVIAGSYNCFGCGASGWWNDLAKALSLKTIVKEGRDIEPEDEFSILRSKLNVIEKQQIEEFTLPPKLYEWDLGSWRGYSSEFLYNFQPAKIYDERYREWRILFPVTHFKKLMGYISERRDKSKSLKHIFSKNFPSSKLLYPIDLHRGTKVILVEGLTDMLRLRSEGLPALCFFGTGNWKINKANILASLGIEDIIVCGDGDIAGWSINRTIYKDLKEIFNVKIFDIPKKSSDLIRYSKKQLINYIEKNKLQIKTMNKEAKELFNQIASHIDNKGWDPDNMPYRFIERLKKLC